MINRIAVTYRHLSHCRLKELRSAKWPTTTTKGAWDLANVKVERLTYITPNITYTEALRSANRRAHPVQCAVPTAFFSWPLLSLVIRQVWAALVAVSDGHSGVLKRRRPSGSVFVRSELWGSSTEIVIHSVFLLHFVEYNFSSRYFNIIFFL